jgi:hypothetical protein
MKSALWPLVLLWLAVHAFVLALILGVKFVTAKTLMIILLTGTAFWFLLGRRKTPSLLTAPGASNDARV